MCQRLQTVVLYRPVGSQELELIRLNGSRAFPARLLGQPIFYPALTEVYASQIAREWNAAGPTGVGYVTRFDIRAEFILRYSVQIAGGRQCQEYWIPAEDLPEFNRNIIGDIKVIAEYRKKGAT